MLRVFGALLVLSVVLFFALTRTEVGRQQLKEQIEAAFDERFAGSLRIGTLTGNLVGTVYARDVRIRTPDGQVVLSADSVRALPRWRSLLSRAVSFRSVDLVGPRLDLTRSEDGTWNVARAFRTDAPERSNDDAPFTLRFSDVTVREGRVTVENRGPPPSLVRSGWLFDYANARLTDIDAALSLERADDEGLQIDLRRLRGHLADADVPLRSAGGQLTVSEGGLSLTPWRVELGRTALQGTFEWTPRGDRPPSVNVDLAESRLDHDEIRRLVPRWPLRAATTARLEASGPLDALTLDSLRLERGSSTLQASGMVRGLPDALGFDLRFDENRLTAADLRAVLPGLPPEALDRLARFGTTRFSAEAEGRLDGFSSSSALRAATRFDVRTEAGALRGTAGARRRAGGALAYDAQVRAEDFEAGRLGETSGLPSQLTGTLSLEGEGTSAQALAGALEARLERSIVAGRQIDGLELDVERASGDRLSGTATVRQRGGRLRVEGRADLSGPVPAYAFTARGQRFDLGALLNRDSLATSLTGTARVDGRGASLDALAGQLRLALDSSAVSFGGRRRVLPPLASTLRLGAPGSTDPRILLRGDLADLTVDGEADLGALRNLGRLWGNALADAFREAYRKPYPPTTDEDVQEAPEEPSRAAPRPSRESRRAVRRALAAAALGDAVDLTAVLSVKRPDVLHALAPEFPALRDSAQMRLNLHAGADTLALDGALRTPQVQSRRAQAAEVEGTFRARASLAAPLLETLDAAFALRADTLALGQTRILSPVFSADIRERNGDVQLTARTADGRGSLDLDAGLALLPERNRLNVRTLRLASGDYVWETASANAVVDLYESALVVPGLTLESRNGGAERLPQRLDVRGALSEAPSDTLFADARRVRLQSLSQLAGVGRPIGGRLDARVAWTGGPQAPELTGRLDVHRLRYDRHLIGRLTAESRFVPGSPRVAFEARLLPTDPPPASSSLTVEENRLAVGGTVALPGLRGGEESRAGALDLALDVERADLFFFDYIFDDRITEADGALSGSGRIGGSFDDPVFQGDFRIADGSFRIPRFGLQYEAEGPVSVSREGLQIDGARLTDPNGGTARIEGALLFNDYAFFSFDLTALLDEFQVIDVEDPEEALPFYGRLAGSGPLRLRGPLSDARLTSDRLRTTPESEIVIPIGAEGGRASESGFILFADSTGRLPDFEAATERESILDERPAGTRSFADGLDLDLGLTAPAGSTVRLVFDPLLGDEIAAVGGGRVQLLREEGDFSLYGTFDVNAGYYLFTAGQVFQRRFDIEGGTLRWDGAAGNAEIDLDATYRTRASRAGLPGTSENDATSRIPVLVRLGINGRVQQPAVDLSLAVDRRRERGFNDFSTAGLETVLNRSDRGSEYATSVLLTNTFLLTTDLAERSGGENQRLSETGNRLAFNSVSQLVSSQLNRYLDAALPNLDVNLGVQGENPQNLDVIYGVALRLLNERLIIRGEGVLDGTNRAQQETEGFEGEFVVEVRLTSKVSAEAFYRREGSLLSDQALTSTTGAGLSYQTEFPTWKNLWHRLFGWLGAPDPEASDPEAPAPEERPTVAAEE